MTWMLGRLRAWIVGIGAALVLGVALVWQAWSRGYEARKDDENDETLDRLGKGRDRLRDHDGLSPDERLRRNDGDW